MSAERSPELDQLASALCAAQAEFTAIPKDSTNPFFKSSYAGLPKVVEVASPILTKHGLSVSQFIGVNDNGFDTLTTWLLHNSGQFIAQSMRLHLTKDDAQGQGSATTYARRYSYMAALGLVADDDDDGNKGSARQRNGGQQAKPTQATPKTAVPLKVTTEDAQEIKAACEGLSREQVRLAFGAVGLDAMPFSAIPREKAPALVQKLAEAKR